MRSTVVVRPDACPVCEGEVDSRSHAKTAFLECHRCGYCLLLDQGREDYWDSPEEERHQAFWDAAKERYFGKTLELLGTLVPGRRLVDIGGGIGIFAERAIDLGWDAFTLDRSERATELAAQRLGLQRAWSAFPEEVAGTFDAATLWCVVAHTKAPSEIIDLAVHALRPGGILWLTTPNFAFQRPYAQARRLINRPLDYARDDHVGHFTPRALKTLLAHHGLVDVRFQFRGITETCIAADSSRPMLVMAKRQWNRVAFAMQRIGLPNLMSELQVTARRNHRTPGSSSLV